MNESHTCEMVEDERFKSGGVIMLFGGMDNIQQETRMVCKKCDAIDYILKKDAKSVQGEESG